MSSSSACYQNYSTDEKDPAVYEDYEIVSVIVQVTFKLLSVVKPNNTYQWRSVIFDGNKWF